MAQWNSANNHLQQFNKTLFEVNMPNNQGLLAADWNLQVAMGRVSGASLVNLYGYQAAVSNSWVPVWENATAYTYPPDAGTSMLLYSTSTSDNNVTVLIDGLDANFMMQS